MTEAEHRILSSALAAFEASVGSKQPVWRTSVAVLDQIELDTRVLRAGRIKLGSITAASVKHYLLSIPSVNDVEKQSAVIYSAFTATFSALALEKLFAGDRLYRGHLED